ncbi:UDP-galactose transporter [Necator americanus]|uniref:UDP-galactose transporter n=1 Tax=Necator americanus TaxID=51031 RepID=W2TQ27_NECAM|nr:UDP-galactose transporter [Necator americanus]ETN83231.1 UDP-galactose transporter [Necator americanus]
MGVDKDDAKETLLPVKTSDINIVKEGTGRRDLLFKAYVIVTMTWLWTGYTITVRYTRTTVPKDELYAATTVVLMAETVKVCISLIMLYKENHFRTTEFMLVTTQLKVFTTAIFMMLFLGRRFSGTRWAAILLLFFGVAAVQHEDISFELNSVGDTSSDKKGSYSVGITAVLCTCVTAGFAGVYFEMMLKGGGTTPFWVRNLQMYSCGIVSASIGCMLSEAELVAQRGFFYGYDVKVCAIVGMYSFLRYFFQTRLLFLF